MSTFTITLKNGKAVPASFNAGSYACSSLKLYGYSSERALVNAANRAWKAASKEYARQCDAAYQAE